MRVGLSTADGVVIVEVDCAETAQLIEQISAMSESDELDYWGGLVYSGEEFDEAEESGVSVTYEQALTAQQKLEHCDKEGEDFEDFFLEVWQEDLNLF